MTNAKTPLKLIALLGAGVLNALPVAIFQSDAVAADQSPQAAYPWFSRPSSSPDDYDTWQGATGNDVGEAAVDPERLPSRVDNSQRPEFPPVYRQEWNCCSQFGSAASVFTYEMNVLTGQKADDDANRFPAHFTWNMVNGADNHGSEIIHAWEVAKRVGIPTAQTYGGVRLDQIGLWPDGYDIWYDAMTHRVAGYRFTPTTTLAQLNEARGWLFDRNTPSDEDVDQVPGGLFAIDGRMTDIPHVTIAQGEHAAGEDLWTRWGPREFGHVMACVGYDDEVGYDLNGDGQITNDIDINDDGNVTLADWERGAFIIVNSWGERWSGDGRIYLLYSAMVDTDWERGHYLARVEVTEHEPRMTLRLILACNDRTDLRLQVGIADDIDADQPDHTISPDAFNGWPIFGGTHPGHVPMAGPDNDKPIEVGIDLTELCEAIENSRDGQARIFLTLSRAEGSEATGELHEAALLVYDDKGQLIREQVIDIPAGSFGEQTLEVNRRISGLPRP